MAETQYKVIETNQPEFPIRSLIEISGDRNLTASLLAFGPNYFNDNVAEMQKSYSHPQTGKTISFREPTTAESILVASCDFKNRAKPKIFDPRWLQAGWIVRTSEGVFVNPLDAQGNPITNEQILKSYLKADKKVNGIYLLDNDSGFAPYDSFTRGVQDCDTFAQGGLARVLEHTPEKVAEQLRAIASPKFYKRGVNVWGFGDVKEPVLKVVGLDSGRSLGGRRLGVVGYGWSDDGDGGGGNSGYAFGVLDKSAEGASQTGEN